MHSGGSEVIINLMTFYCFVVAVAEWIVEFAY